MLESLIKILQLQLVDNLLHNLFKKMRKEGKHKRSRLVKKMKFLLVNSNGLKYLKSNSQPKII
jgi:hypothetical protein